MRRSLAITVGGAALLGLTVAAARTHPPAYVHPVGMYVEGRLHGDARTGCVWLADPGPATQVRWPPGVTVRFGPQVQLVRGGHVVAGEGALLGTQVRSSTRPDAGCPTAVKAAVEGTNLQLGPGVPRRR